MIYQVVRQDKHPKYGLLDNVVARRTTKSEAITEASEQVRAWRRSGGTAWRLNSDGSWWELRNRKSVAGFVLVRAERDKPRCCSVCGGEDGECNPETHKAEGIW